MQAPPTSTDLPARCAGGGVGAIRADANGVIGASAASTASASASPASAIASAIGANITSVSATGAASGLCLPDALRPYAPAARSIPQWQS